MPLAACVTPAAGTIASVPMPAPVRLTASAMKAPPHSCATRTGVIGLRGAELVVELGVVHAGDAEREADPQLLERFAGELAAVFCMLPPRGAQRSLSGGESAGQVLIMRQSPSP